MSWVFVMLFAALVAGFVQGVTGFGSGIIMMIFLPSLLPINQSAGVSTLTMVVAIIMVAWHYRKFLRWQKLVVPFIIYICMAIFSVYLSKFIATGYLKILLGLLLVTLALYYLFMNIHSIKLKTIPIYVMVIFALVSGFFNGMFGIGGPLMALYFLTISNSKENYLASIQTFFLMDTIFITTMRFASGVLTLGNFKYILVGMVGAIVGTILANRFVKHLNLKVMTYCIYGFIGISGVYYLLTALT
ncbi:sulfite exporter TauE/SafE family protein [Companilactobacillus huachuanensis]|uniref:Probable membrane transporter protein n=1 Tax=Companilactobacillus huachuanensis TaxID=2559914 RepID=A0ABW1RP65_9LACO|nr:sulfite exporter TauE/SafE family protein [Companilactobacillus huachuanensis]